MAKDSLPAFDRLRDELARIRPDLSFVSPFDLAADTGYQPMLFGGNKAGFEWYVDDAEEALDSWQCSLNTGADMLELASASFVAVALAAVSGGRLFDDNLDELSPAEMLDVAEEALEFWRSSSR